MSWLFVDIAIIAAFLYYRRNKIVAASNLSRTIQYLRLWLLPIFQFVICAIIVFFSFAALNFLLSKSPFMDQIIKKVVLRRGDSGDHSADKSGTGGQT